MATMEETNAYNLGFEVGKLKAFQMREDADGCVGCAFGDVESWQMPCERCARNCKDYWRAKKV